MIVVIKAYFGRAFYAESQPNYEANYFMDRPKEAPEYKEPVWDAETSIVNRYNHRDGNDDYEQSGNLFRLFNDGLNQETFLYFHSLKIGSAS